MNTTTYNALDKINALPPQDIVQVFDQQGNIIGVVNNEGHISIDNLSAAHESTNWGNTQDPSLNISREYAAWVNDDDYTAANICAVMNPTSPMPHFDSTFAIQALSWSDGTQDFSNNKTTAILANARHTATSGIGSLSSILATASLGNGNVIANLACTEFQGGEFAADAYNATVTTQNALHVSQSTISGCTVGTYHGLYVEAPSVSSSTITNAYGIRIAPHTNGTNKTALYIENQGSGNAIKVDGGAIIFSNLPTVNPHVVGQLWNNAGVLNVSAG